MNIESQLGIKTISMICFSRFIYVLIMLSQLEITEYHVNISITEYQIFIGQTLRIFFINIIVIAIMGFEPYTIES